MKTYTASHMIKMEDLNHHRSLYAGRAIEWMVEAAYMAAAVETGNKEGVLFKNCHKFDFMKSAWPGQVISFRSTIVRCGRSSLTIRVGMYNEENSELLAEGFVTIVMTNAETGEIIAHGIRLDETAGLLEFQWRREADSYFTR